MNFTEFEATLMLSLLEEKEQAIKSEIVKNDRKIQALKEENYQLECNVQSLITIRDSMFLMKLINEVE